MHLREDKKTLQTNNVLFFFSRHNEFAEHAIYTDKYGPEFSIIRLPLSLFSLFLSLSPSPSQSLFMSLLPSFSLSLSLPLSYLLPLTSPSPSLSLSLSLTHYRSSVKELKLMNG